MTETATGLECAHDPTRYGCVAHRITPVTVVRQHLGGGEYGKPYLLDFPRLIGISPEALDLMADALTVTVTPDAADVDVCGNRYQLVAYCDVERALVGERQW